MQKKNNVNGSIYEFNGKAIRSKLCADKSEWFFSAIDVVQAITEQESYNQARKHWSMIKIRWKEINETQLATVCGQLKLIAADGKSYNSDVLNKTGVLSLAAQQKHTNIDELVEWLAQFDLEEKLFVLKHKDVAVIEVGLDTTGLISTFGKLLNAAHLPVGTVFHTEVDYELIRDWWKGRAIPASRDGIRDLLEPLDIKLPQQLLEKSFGLSLSDQYWICPINSNLKWENINFFHNSFSEDVGNLLFRNLDWVELDKSAISLHSPDNTSDGVLKKKWKIIDGKRCLIKGSSNLYNQEVANEVLASRICDRLGIPYAPYTMKEQSGKIYSVCEDFIDGDSELVTAWHIKNLIKRDNNASDYDSIIAKAEELGIFDVKRKIDMMLTLDFIIVNTDRHYNNFGFIRDANTLEWLRVAPIYDSGTSMWCKQTLDEESTKDVNLESRPFRGKHDKQIQLVKDFAWLNLNALDGIENEFAEILKESVKGSTEFAERHQKLCKALRKRIETLRSIVEQRNKMK